MEGPLWPCDCAGNIPSDYVEAGVRFDFIQFNHRGSSFILRVNFGANFGATIHGLTDRK